MVSVKTLVWQQWDNVGLEYLELTESGKEVKVDSTVIGFEDNRPFRLRYQIRCDIHYQVQQLTLDLAGHEEILLTTDGAGHWFDMHNQPLLHLDGCIDIDISATPFTNALPIKRLDWQIDQNRSLDMVYIRIPELTIERVTQQYTCLEKNRHSGLFEYSQPAFKAVLPIDADGFVQNYPNLFRRLS
jgi:uncharacterized protein